MNEVFPVFPDCYDSKCSVLTSSGQLQPLFTLPNETYSVTGAVFFIFNQVRLFLYILGIWTSVSVIKNIGFHGWLECRKFHMVLSLNKSSCSVPITKPPPFKWITLLLLRH